MTTKSYLLSWIDKAGLPDQRFWTLYPYNQVPSTETRRCAATLITRLYDFAQDIDVEVGLSSTGMIVTAKIYNVNIQLMLHSWLSPRNLVEYCMSFDSILHSRGFLSLYGSVDSSTPTVSLQHVLEQARAGISSNC